MEITASQSDDVTNLTCAISPPRREGRSQETTLLDKLNKVRQLLAAEGLNTSLQSKQRYFGLFSTKRLFASVLSISRVLFPAVVTTTLAVCSAIWGVYSLNKLSYLLQQGVSGWLVIARHNEGCEKPVCCCGCVRVCFQDQDEALIDMCVCVHYVWELATLGHAPFEVRLTHNGTAEHDGLVSCLLGGEREQGKKEEKITPNLYRVTVNK